MVFLKYKPAQPLALRQLNNKFAMNHKNATRTKAKFSRQFQDSGKQLALGFGQKSTIHGVNRIFQENSNKYER